MNQMDVVANNVANMNTTGYQADYMLFEKYMEKTGNKPKDQLAFVQDSAVYRDLRHGNGQVTGNPLDVMINGDGYFAVNTPNGVRYTRAGNFQVDANGQLVTAQGYAVAGRGGAIQFLENDKNIVIRGDGSVVADGEERGQIDVVRFDNPGLLRKTGGALLESDIPGVSDVNATVSQGILEGSNVQPVLEMTRLIQISRVIGSTSQFIEDAYNLQQQAMTTLARQR